MSILTGCGASHFPAERNFLRAHLTLFHHLPGDGLERLTLDLTEIAAANSEIELNFTGWRFLGRGVAVNVESPALAAVRAEIARRWHTHLTPQDRQPFRPHITIQNKVPPDEARTLHAALIRQTTPLKATVPALELHRYKNGPWIKISEFRLSDP